jgi:predicted glycogen debranching enzyme
VIILDKSVVSDFEAALGREWLETNGLGGFACGTVAGANTRRYHGLLTAALNPPGGRMLLLSKIEETVVVEDQRIDLSTNEYSGAIHPRGYRYLTSFHQDPFPTWTFEVDGIMLQKTVFMPHGRNTVQVEYRAIQIPQGRELTLEVRPLIAFRDYHSTTHENGALQQEFTVEDSRVTVQPYAALPPLHFAHDAERVGKEGYWYRNFLYQMERERGLDYYEDLFNPLVFSWSLKRKGSAVVIASTEKLDVRHAATVRKAEIERRQALLAKTPADNPFAQTLTLAADQYFARRGEDWTVIAGYPWFTDWGRDTMISLPGLTLYTGRTEVAKSILRNFARHTDLGMLPNRFVDAGETAEFNTVDATLWFFEAARAYAAVTDDYDFIRQEVYPVFTQIIDWHVKGTRYNIKVLDNGLLNAGSPGAQLTWMDAKIGDWVVTPRSGKPVEIQALWYNALRIMEDLAERLGEEERRKKYSNMASLCSWTFNRLFWNKEGNCLYDVVNGGAPDSSIRPNQIFAVSLHHSMVPLERARAIVENVERELLTPVGLRTLSRAHREYRAVYGGDQYSRDSAYHQGTVWPWLLGPFVSAYVRVNGGSRAARERAHELLSGLHAHLQQAGLGQISEIFDADAPHHPRGCFAQAWSVAEILRALCEDVYQVRTAVKQEAAMAG